MRDQLETRISVVECIQEEFGHDIREIKEELVKLVKLVKNALEQKFCTFKSLHPL